jgi:ATP-dependent RNA helicase SUPV3L1/SUV3
MMMEQAARGRVLAVLGPTNTGKTHFAVERMLAHASGMIGFPLRLLAREIYDRIVAIKGSEAVALRTGEEKIGRDDARFLIATVEAMPMQREVAFLAVDEIQLCADPERGHVFTDRLLHARGTGETMFLGSGTIRPLLKHLVPEAEIITRPRFSTLSFAGHHKLTRLPRRSAVVAFSAADVYTLGEVIRRQRGGAAVVLGALSPRTRNAQVELYQSGEVDHLVATDAIGMGLNMDLAHVGFAAVHKFDGRQLRRLHAAELAQIAGRAGRHMADGTFGTTNGCPDLDDQLVEAVENHDFPALKALRWRNSELDFRSIDALLASLDAPPFAGCLIKVRDAIDDRSLALLSQREDIRARADRPERVRLLWQVCQIPDFRKTLTDAHLQILATVFRHVSTGRGTLPNDWVGRMVTRLDQMDGDIDTLVTRLAHIRTWTYLSHRDAWFEDAAHWQGIARDVEDRLSDALHERLTQRFVDRRTAALIRGLRERGELSAAVDEGGEVVVDGHLVGRLDGLSFTVAASDAELDRKVLARAARKAVGPELFRRAKAIGAAPNGAFSLAGGDAILWEGAVLGRILPGPEVLRPRVKAAASDVLAERAADAVEARLARWLESWLAQRLAPLHRLAEAAAGDDIGGAARGIAFSVLEGLGSAEREPLERLLGQLSQADRRRLTRLGLRFGRLSIFIQDLLRPGAIEARARLLRLQGEGPLELPPPGRTVLRAGEADALTADVARRMGFVAFAGFLVRQDVVERLAAGIRARGQAGASFPLPVELAAEAGLTRGELETVLGELGYRARAENDATLYAADRRRRRHAPPRRPARAAPHAHSPFAVLASLKVAP